MTHPGPDPSLDAGFPALYAELRTLARRALRGERADHTLQPTALVHEVYLKLGPDGEGTFHGRAHFLPIAATAMRRVLVDHARRRSTTKRGGQWQRIDLDEALRREDLDLDLILDMEKALKRLSEIDPRLTSMVQMRFYGGMTEAEVAEHFDKSPRWVRKQWAFARAWLRDALQRG